VVGRAIRSDRGWWVLATKLANPTSPGPNDRGLSRRHCLLGADASLRRLGTDAVDILYLARGAFRHHQRLPPRAPADSERHPATMLAAMGVCVALGNQARPARAASCGRLGR